MDPSDVNEGQILTLSCSARGRPQPTFKWFHNELLVSTQAQWTIPSIIYSNAGNYTCTAQNTHGEAKSPPWQINVLSKSIRYWPQCGIFLNVLPYYLFVLIVKSDSWIKKENNIPPPDFLIDYYLDELKYQQSLFQLSQRLRYRRIRLLMSLKREMLYHYPAM